MKMKKLSLFAVILLLCSGCATSVCRHYKVPEGTTSSTGKSVVAAISGQNRGCYLFYVIPVWSGKPHRPNENKWSLWRHRVRERDIRRMFVQRAKQIGADDIEDVKVQEDCSGLWSLGILWNRSVSGNCVAVKNPSGKEQRKAEKAK